MNKIKLPHEFLNEARSITKISKELANVTSRMKELADEFYEKKSQGVHQVGRNDDRLEEIKDELRELTPKKKALIEELDNSVAGKDRNIELAIEESVNEASIELDAIDHTNKVLLKQLKSLKVKMKVISDKGPGGGAAVIELTGKREALEDVVSNPVWGWDDPDLEELIQERKVNEEGAYKKNDKGSMLTSIIKAKSAQNYGLDNLIVLHKDIKKVFTSKENKQELLHDLNNVIEYMKKADKFKAAGRSNDNTISMVEKYWKQLSGQTVARTQKTITEGKVNEAGDAKKYKQFWDKGPETQIRRRFGKDFDKAIDNRVKLLLTLVEDPDKAENYAEMDFLSLPDIISTGLVNMNPKELHAILDESSVTEGLTVKQALRNASDALTETPASKNLDKSYVKDYLKSLERMAKRDPKSFVKDYGEMTINDYIEDVEYNMRNESVTEYGGAEWSVITAAKNFLYIDMGKFRDKLKDKKHLKAFDKAKKAFWETVGAVAEEHHEMYEGKTNEAIKSNIKKKWASTDTMMDDLREFILDAKDAGGEDLVRDIHSALKLMTNYAEGELKESASPKIKGFDIFVSENGNQIECPECGGSGCDHCDNKGFHIDEGLSKSAIKKMIKVIDKQIDTETGGDGEALDNETLQALEKEKSRLENMVESKVNEARNIQTKRKYTENHPSKTVGRSARIRNKILEALKDGKLTQNEFDTLVKELSSDHKRWMKRNGKMFNVSEDGISLSKFGKRILKGIVVNESFSSFKESLNE